LAPIARSHITPAQTIELTLEGLAESKQLAVLSAARGP